MNRRQMMRKKRKAETKKGMMKMKRVKRKRKRKAKKVEMKEMENKTKLMTGTMKRRKKQKRGRPQQIICQILMSQGLLQKSLAWIHSLHLQVTQYYSRIRLQGKLQYFAPCYAGQHFSLLGIIIFIGQPQSSGGATTGVESSFEEDVRRYLARKPMTTTEILKKIKSKRTGIQKDELMPLLVSALKRINPHKHKVKGVMYLSLKPNK